MSENKKKNKAKKTSDPEKLLIELEELKQEKEELFFQLQRVSADYANFQKRVPKQITDSVSIEKESIIKSLLPAFDNFDHTLDKIKHAENIDDVIKGIEIIYSQMLDILKSFGVEQINALGEKFNPTVHQAMMQRSEDDKEEGIILEEFQKGYRLNGLVIRPNKVVVNKLSAEMSEESGQETEEPEEEKENQ
jgi:molecular chaperone GrpE